MIIKCLKDHAVPKSYQVIVAGCPCCEQFSYHSLEGKPIDWPESIKDADIEKAKKEGFRNGVKFAINNFLDSAEIPAEIIAFHD